MTDSPALPVDAVLPELRRALAVGRNAVLQAPPGAGKTTRVPLALLSEPWLADRRIIMLEPRRLATRAAARYMAQELGETVGDTVGYRVRLDTRVGPRTRIEVVTEGVLTRLLQADPELTGIGLVIFDEFHERSLQADLGLALCRESQQALREDLRLLVMSATMDAAPVAALLGHAATIASEGRVWPVDVHYAPPPDDDVPSHAVRVILRALDEETGSMLVFLPGVAEITRVAGRLQDRLAGGDVDVTPLYGDLPADRQEQAIRPAPAGRRKVVLATNIAETSLTIEGIRMVVDSGLARVARFEPRVGMTRLHTVAVSQASAAQRCGRAGRLEPGACYRLWSESRQRALAPFDNPEIAQADLTPLALELARWGVTDPAALAWLDPPPMAAYDRAVDLLRELGALNSAGHITSHGRRMAELAMHPRLAHMVLTAESLKRGALGCELAALLSERDLLSGHERSADLRRRLDMLREPDSRREDSVTVARAILRRVRTAAAQWQRQLGVAPVPADNADLPDAGLLLAFAYPDRIAQRRPGSDGRFLLAGGRGAWLPVTEPLAAGDYLVAAHLDAGAREARIFLAASIERQQLLEHFAADIRDVEIIAWDSREQAVAARRERRLGNLILAAEPLANPDPEQLVAAMMDGIRVLGVDALPWTDALHRWRQRVQFLHGLDEDRWPDLSDQALLQSLQSWLGPFLAGITRASHLRRVDLTGALQALLPWEDRRALDELAPTHITVPSGSRIAVDYGGETPVLAVRLQELFGSTDTPRVAAGRVPVLIHLLSPAGRPVQVTRDLASFWAGAYQEVKKDLKGRYPKHHWPDDPLQAEPTRRTKRRS
ncbi:MAG: ATP-dependent helicase HrpB [Gammaproteobacteria bacterium]